MCFSKFEEFFSVLKEDDEVAILTHHYPDPDCIGAAAGMSFLLQQKFGLSSKIFHHGEISHPQNKAMKNVLNISLANAEDFDRTNFAAFIVVDTDFSSTGFKTDKFDKVDMRIDHHQMDREDKPQLFDVRPVGSTCAIVWDYIQRFEINLQESPAIATAMVLGIKTDTHDFTSVTSSELDMEAYRSLLPFIDRVALAKVMNYPLPREMFELESVAYRAKEIQGTVLCSYVGELSNGNRDIVSTLADRFFRMAGVNTVVIFAVIDNFLQASVRSDDSTVNVNDLCIKVFGKDYSGAKKGSGGARVPVDALSYISDGEVRAAAIREIVANFQHRVFNLLGGEESGE